MRLELATFRSAPASASLIAQWRVGSIVEAIALRDPSDGKLWLSIGATRVPARIASGDAAGPANGERLQLRVLRDHPVLALETLPMEPDNEAAVVGDALRRNLPRQASPAPLQANLAWLAKHVADQSQLNRPVRDAVQRLWQAMPDAKELQTAEGLAKAIQRSGAFLETNLAAIDPNDVRAQRATLATDLKALLLNLKQTLLRSGAMPHASEQPAPAPLPTLRGPLLPLPTAAANVAAIEVPARALNELAAQADHALARTNTLQLVNSEATNVAAAWLVELPIRREGEPENIRFRFERHSPHDSAEQSWTVEAAMDLGERGSLHARVSLHGKRIGVQFRADPATLVVELNSQTPALTAMLRASGLDVDRIVCLHGMPAEDRDVHATTLLDIRV